VRRPTRSLRVGHASRRGGLDFPTT